MPLRQLGLFASVFKLLKYDGQLKQQSAKTWTWLKKLPNDPKNVISEYFPNEDKYTLQPLLDDGVNSLSCLDIDGLAEVRLTEVQLLFRGPYNDRTILRSKDIFKSLQSRSRNFPDYGNLVAASFQVKFDSSSKPRTVKIKTPNIASFDRKEDAHIIEQWMKARGFIKPQDVVTDEDTDEVVAYVAEAAVA